MEIDRSESYTVSGCGKKVVVEKRARGRKSWVIFCIIFIIFIFLTGMAGGALWRYLYEISLLDGLEEECPLCRLKTEGRLRVKAGSGLGILQLHTGQSIVLEQNREKENKISILLMYAGEYGSTVETESSRKVSEIDIFLSEESVWDREISKDILCEACMEELNGVGQETDDGTGYDVVLVDLGSGETLQVKEGISICFTKDYVLHFDHYENRVGIVAAYVPDK